MLVVNAAISVVFRPRAHLVVAPRADLWRETLDCVYLGRVASTHRLAHPPGAVGEMALHRKQLPLRTTQTIAAAASTRDAFPLYKCGVLAKDALVLITELCDDLAGNNKLLPKAELVRAFLRHAGGTPRKHEKYDGVVLKAVTALSSYNRSLAWERE